MKLANAQGVAASRATTLDEFATHLRAALAERGPHLVEVMLNLTSALKADTTRFRSVRL